MSINLPSVYQNIEAQQIISYDYPITIEEGASLFSYLPKEDTRFFWQTPDQSITYYASGSCVDFPIDDSLPTRIATYRKQYLFHDIPTKVMGAYPFDLDDARESKEFGSLATGGFFIPRYLIEQTPDKTTVILTTTAGDSFEELTQTFEQMAKQVYRRAAVDGKNKLMLKQEIGVRAWKETVQEAVDTIVKQHSPIKKIVLARQMQILMYEPLQAQAVLTRLQAQQPNTYLFFYERKDYSFLGATPERLLAATTEVVYTAAVAGSIARGKTLEEDVQFGQTLLDSAKNTHEHQIVVDRIIRELQPFVDEVKIYDRTLLKNRDIQHLYAVIEGQRLPQLSFLEMIKQLHPTPALGGEPKALAVKWIRDHEVINRGLYGAPIGWVSLVADEGEFAVGIRSAVCHKNQAILYAGCGIVADSIPEEERQETQIKFQPMLRGILGDDASRNHD